MKKVYQRIIDPKKGDCFKCCIASLLELDYDEVPNFVEQEDWFGAAIDFCKEHGYDFAYREYFNPNLNYLEYPTYGCFKPWNLDGIYRLDKLGREEGIDGLFLAGVYSPRYTNAEEHPMRHLHSVIIDKDCNIVFDPQKEYEGILEYPYSRIIGYNGIRDVMVITKLKEEKK